MSSTMGIDGLVSGLDTTGTHQQPHADRGRSSDPPQAKQSTAQDVVDRAAGHQHQASVASRPPPRRPQPPPTGPPSRRRRAQAPSLQRTTTSATGGSITFSVDAVANRQVSLTAAVTDGSRLTADNPPDAHDQEGERRPGDLHRRIEQPERHRLRHQPDRARASRPPRCGVNSGSPASYRLQFTAGTTGTDGAFEVYVGDECGGHRDDRDPARHGRGDDRNRRADHAVEGHRLRAGLHAVLQYLHRADDGGRRHGVAADRRRRDGHRRCGDRSQPRCRTSPRTWWAR